MAEKDDKTNDIDDLNEFVQDLGGWIAALTILEAKYKSQKYVRRKMEHALASLKSASVDILLAADELGETLSPPTT